MQERRVRNVEGVLDGGVHRGIDVVAQYDLSCARAEIGESERFTDRCPVGFRPEPDHPVALNGGVRADAAAFAHRAFAAGDGDARRRSRSAIRGSRTRACRLAPDPRRAARCGVGNGRRGRRAGLARRGTRREVCPSARSRSAAGCPARCSCRRGTTPAGGRRPRTDRARRQPSRLQPPRFRVRRQSGVRWRGQ